MRFFAYYQDGGWALSGRCFAGPFLDWVTEVAELGSKVRGMRWVNCIEFTIPVKFLDLVLEI